MTANEFVVQMAAVLVMGSQELATRLLATPAITPALIAEVMQAKPAEFAQLCALARSTPAVTQNPPSPAPAASGPPETPEPSRIDGWYAGLGWWKYLAVLVAVAGGISIIMTLVLGLGVALVVGGLFLLRSLKAAVGWGGALVAASFLLYGWAEFLWEPLPRGKPQKASVAASQPQARRVVQAASLTQPQPSNRPAAEVCPDPAKVTAETLRSPVCMPPEYAKWTCAELRRQFEFARNEGEGQYHVELIGCDPSGVYIARLKKGEVAEITYLLGMVVRGDLTPNIWGASYQSGAEQLKFKYPRAAKHSVVVLMGDELAAQFINTGARPVVRFVAKKDGDLRLAFNAETYANVGIYKTGVAWVMKLKVKITKSQPTTASVPAKRARR